MVRQALWSELGRESLEVYLDLKDGVVEKVRMKARGSLQFLRTSQSMKSQLLGHSLDQLALPTGHDSTSLIWREVLLRLQEKWPEPTEGELCHCRKIETEVVTLAIVYGAHSVAEVRRQTSANTGCGTCLPDVRAWLKLYLGEP